MYVACLPMSCYGDTVIGNAKSCGRISGSLSWFGVEQGVLPRVSENGATGKPTVKR